MAPVTRNFLVYPNNEVLVVHVALLHARRFGSRKHSDMHDLVEYQIPTHGEVFHIGWPGKAQLSWAKQDTSLQVYGPGTLSTKPLPGRYGSMLPEPQPGVHVAMLSSRLDLG